MRLSRLKTKVATFIAYKKVISHLKKSRENAFQTGREFCSIYCIIYSEFKNNDLYDVRNIWNSLCRVNGFSNMAIYSLLNKDIDFPKFFSKFNLNLLRLNPVLLSCFFRGYYINDMNLFSTNIQTGTFTGNSSSTKYVILYDNHYHYLLFIYNYLSTNHANMSNGINMQLNNCNDMYSINEESDSTCYKLIFEKKEFDFIDPIRLLLNFLYSHMIDASDALGHEDRYLYALYSKYSINT